MDHTNLYTFPVRALSFDSLAESNEQGRERTYSELDPSGVPSLALDKLESPDLGALISGLQTS